MVLLSPLMLFLMALVVAFCWDRELRACTALGFSPNWSINMSCIEWISFSVAPEM